MGYKPKPERLRTAGDITKEDGWGIKQSTIMGEQPSRLKARRSDISSRRDRKKHDC